MNPNIDNEDILRKDQPFEHLGSQLLGDRKAAVLDRLDERMVFGKRTQSKNVIKYAGMLAVAASICYICCNWTYFVSTPATGENVSMVLAYDDLEEDIKWAISSPSRGPVTSSATSINQLQFKAFAAYKTKDYALAQSTFESLVSQQPLQPAYFLYLGHCASRLGDYAKALHALESARGIFLKESNMEGAQYSRWYLALTLLKTNDVEAGGKELKKLVAENSFLKDKAVILLKRLSIS